LRTGTDGDSEGYVSFLISFVVGSGLDGVLRGFFRSTFCGRSGGRMGIRSWMSGGGLMGGFGGKTCCLLFTPVAGPSDWLPRRIPLSANGLLYSGGRGGLKRGLLTKSGGSGTRDWDGEAVVVLTDTEGAGVEVVVVGAAVVLEGAAVLP
jgi:hypothetical protein